MEGTGTTKARWTFAKAGAIIALAGLLGGLSACGSEDSGESAAAGAAKPSETVADKQAGLGVALRVANKGADDLRLQLCSVSDTTGTPSQCRSYTLGGDQIESLTADGVLGTVELQSGGQPPVEFKAVNPFVGSPYVALKWMGDSTKLGLDEGERAFARMGDFRFVASREADTDFKLLTLEVSR